jgi:hypothetical protein
MFQWTRDLNLVEYTNVHVRPPLVG